MDDFDHLKSYIEGALHAAAPRPDSPAPSAPAPQVQINFHAPLNFHAPVTVHLAPAPLTKKSL